MSVFALALSSHIEKERTQKTAEQQVEQAPTPEKVKEICEREFGGAPEEDVPVQCLKIFNLK